MATAGKAEERHALFQAADLRAEIQHVLQYFCYAHLPPNLREVSKPFALLADRLNSGPHNRETAVALRKLLEAKDAAVRAALGG